MSASSPSSWVRLSTGTRSGPVRLVLLLVRTGPIRESKLPLAAVSCSRSAVSFSRCLWSKNSLQERNRVGFGPLRSQSPCTHPGADFLAGPVRDQVALRRHFLSEVRHHWCCSRHLVSVCELDPGGGTFTGLKLSLSYQQIKDKPVWLNSMLSFSICYYLLF